MAKQSEKPWMWPLATVAAMSAVGWLCVFLFAPPTMPQKQCTEVLSLILENIKLRKATEPKLPPGHACAKCGAQGEKT